MCRPCDKQAIDGAFFHHALEGLATYGFVMEEDLPYRRTYQPDWQPDPDLLEVAAQNRACSQQSMSTPCLHALRGKAIYLDPACSAKR